MLIVYTIPTAMTSKDIRKIFLDFFKKRDHIEIPSSSLVPERDPTLLFINSGMAPLKDYFLGRRHPPAQRLCNVQRCLRTVDIEKVGPSSATLSFFEMMGTWSIGDYFSKIAIKLAWELLTEEFDFEETRLWATVFAGSDEIPRDTDSLEDWQEVGLPKERIVELPAEDNLWVSGPVGPFGPCTEIYYDRGEEFGCGKPGCKPGCECERFLELWNPGVFMVYNRKEDGTFEELPMKSVDTGAGLERFATVLQNKDSVYEIDLLTPIYKVVESLAGVGAHRDLKVSERIITDHSRAIAFLIADGVVPSNKDRGYVLRRIIRRAYRHGKLLNIGGAFLGQPVEKVVEVMGDEYPYLEENLLKIKQIVQEEERSFEQTLSTGLKELEKRLAGLDEGEEVFPGEVAFELYDTYGFPLDLTVEIAKEAGLEVDEGGFQKELKKQRQRSRAAQKDRSFTPEQIAPLHTATHLMNEALRRVLGSDVHQAGQNLTPERLRFDFTFDRKLADEEIKEVEDIVNEQIEKDFPVVCTETTFEDAVASGAEALFEEKYKGADTVTLYSIGDFSKELCAGPHVKRTGELGEFKVIKQESVGSGVRRIKATLL